MPGVSVKAFSSLISGGYEEYPVRLTGYSHTSQAIGGYWEAGIDISDQRGVIEDWATNGLGRHIETYNDAGIKIWEGFVNGVGANLSGGGSGATLRLDCLGYVHWLLYPYSSATTGLQNLSSKLEAILGQDPNGLISTDYSFVESNTLQVGAYEQSNRKAWGLIKGLVSQGDASDNRYNFGVYNDRVAYYDAIPTTVKYQTTVGAISGQLSIGRGPLLGIGNRVRVVYSTVDASVSPPVLGARASTGAVSDATSQGRYGIIDQVLSTGGSTNDEASEIRDTFLEERKDPTTTQTVGDLLVYDYNTGGEILPYDARPGEWLFVSDFLPGLQPGTNLREDPRMLFIEQMIFTAPRALQLRGGKVDTLSQKLAKLGLSGVGA